MQLSPRQRFGFYRHLIKTLHKDDHLVLQNLLQPYIPDDAIVFDVGGHAGQFAKLFARLCPRGRVYTFEPSPYARSILQIMAGVKFIDNLYIIPFGLSDKPGTATIHTPLKKGRSMGFGLAFIGNADECAHKTMQHDIVLSTMDTIGDALSLSRLDFIKADIEGCEMLMLTGGARTIEKFKPVVMLEISDAHLKRNNHCANDVFQFFATRGYAQPLQICETTGTTQPFTLNGDVTINGDFLFIPN
ncbi:FkbM family methyltransferase [Micavibrio aeruginosavorus]|uniref:FkbM family methyltransferase n=1 Tax=Micavibrio aeruginosavorus TaxID=349221 RepID=UPI003F4AEE5B